MPYLPLLPTAAQPAPTTLVGAPASNNGLTFEELEDELRARLLGRVDVLPERLQLYINLAYVDLATSLKLDELRASVLVPLLAGQHLYLLPEAVFAIETVSLHLPENTPLSMRGRPLEKTGLDRFRRAPIKEGWPKEFFRLGRMLVVYPTPKTSGQGSLAVDFRIRPAFLAQADDCPILGEEWHESILVLATQKALEAVQEWEAALIEENAYIKLVRRRLDPGTIEEDNKVMKSSVPRDNLSLARRRRGRWWFDGME